MTDSWGDASITFERTIFYACLGHGLKDFVIPHKTGMGLIFGIHHTAVFIGTWASMSIPLLGYVVVNAVGAELGSFFYSIYEVSKAEKDKNAPSPITNKRILCKFVLTLLFQYTR